MSKKYSAMYQPLHPDRGIRILILEPGLTNSQICCRLVSANLNNKPEYKALSYEWGPVDDQKTITINGEEVYVRHNLWSALWHLRKNWGNFWVQHTFGSALWKDAGGMRLWVDALCINQDDKVERAKQVSIMGSIYQHADVICWLGKGDGITKLEGTMEQLKILSTSTLFASIKGHLSGDKNHINRLGLHGTNLRGDISFPVAGKTSIAESSTWKSELCGLWSHISYGDVEALCSLDYWQRTWIVQEVVLGKRISICLGNVSVNGIDFYNLCGALLLSKLTLESLLMVPGYRILHLRRIWISQPQNLTLMKLMRFSELSSCSDPKDRIYGMIGLASDCRNGEVVPDYTKSLTEVYYDVALHVLHYPRSKFWDIVFHILHYPYAKSWGVDQTWSNVHFSELIQRAIFGLSVSPFDQTSLLPEAGLEKILGKTKLEISGITYGTVIRPVEPEPGDMWWAHPGFVKPIPFDILTHQSTDTREYCSSRSCPDERNDLLACSRTPFLIRSPEPETSPVGKFLVDTQFGGRFCYAPANTTAGNIVCRFTDSAVAAIITVDDGRYVLVGRAMILGVDQDLSIFAQGMEEQFMLKHQDETETIRFIVTLNELRELTSPYH
jgi:hypothetical protein